jgi:hypothetical protein
MSNCITDKYLHIQIALCKLSFLISMKPNPFFKKSLASMLRHHLSILTVEWHLNDQTFRSDVTLLTSHQKHNVIHSFSQSTWSFWNIWKLSEQKENPPCGCGIQMTYLLYGIMVLKISRVFLYHLNNMRTYIKFNIKMKSSVCNPFLEVLVTKKGASFVTSL